VSSLVARVALAIALAAAGWDVFCQFSARRAYDLAPGIEGVLDALAWDPERSAYHAEAGVIFRDDLERMDLARSIEHLERACELHPWRSGQWVELARAYDRAGRDDDAEAAYLKSIALEQPATDYHWEIANFYMRVGRPDDAFEHLARTIAEEPEYMQSALALLLRAGFPLDEIERAWPADTASRMALLLLAAEWEASAQRGVRHEEVVSLWERLLASDRPPPVEAGDAFVQLLLATGRHGEARRAFTELARRNGLEDAAYATGESDVWDGGFELPPHQAALAWRTWDDEGYAVSRAAGEGVGASAALRVRFDGRANVHLGGVEQLALLEPGETYEIAWASRAEGVTTEEGPRVEVFDRRGDRVLYRSDDTRGTTGWERHAETFDVPDDCGAALVRLVRLPSRRIAGEIEGTFWLDEVRLRRATPGDSP
jgi:tetratricopeptide (TPR) repeat protein